MVSKNGRSRKKIILNKIDKIPSKQVSFYLLNQFILSSFSASKISLKELNK